MRPHKPEADVRTPQTRYMGIVNHLTYGYLDPNLGFLQDISNFQLVLLMEEDRGNPLF